MLHTLIADMFPSPENSVLYSLMVVGMVPLIAVLTIAWIKLMRVYLSPAARRDRKEALQLLYAIARRCPRCDSTMMRQPTQLRPSTKCHICGARFGINDVKVSTAGIKLPKSMEKDDELIGH